MRIDINGHHHETHHHSLTGAQIKALGHHEHGALFRLNGDRQDRVRDDEIVRLREDERFVIVAEAHEGHERREITIDVDGHEFQTDRREMTGAEIKHLAHRPVGNSLYRLEGRERIRARNEAMGYRLHEMGLV